MKNRTLPNISLSVFFCIILAGSLLARDPSSINRYGSQLGEKKQYKEAIDQFDRAIEIYDKESAQTYHNRGWALELEGKTDQALPNYEEALRRNPYQVISGEKAGYIYYKKGDYDNAIRIGEHVLKYDPDNKEVIKWLPDAYTKRLQLKKEKDEKIAKEMEEKEQRIEEQKEQQQQQKEKEAVIVYVTYDFMLRTGYNMSNEKYDFVYDRGYLGDVPSKLFCRITPTMNWKIDVFVENPWLGGLMPSSLCMLNETLEASYKIKKFNIGVGIQFNHYESDISFNRDLRLWDVKVGLLFGYQSDKYSLQFRCYPRLLPFDTKASVNQTMDIDQFGLMYTYKLSSKLAYYVDINWRDYYIMDHTNQLSNWWGIYEFGLGIKLGEILKTNNKRDFSFSFEFKERLYYRDRNNNKPYDPLNGQGWFGLNSDKWLTGGPITGFWTYGHTFGFKFEEEIIKYLFLYQGFYVEMTDTVQGHYEFNFQIGVGGVY